MTTDPTTLAPSPYRFTVSVELDLFQSWCIFVGDDTPGDEHTARDVMFVAEFDTEAEARTAAAQVLAALHQATIEGDES